MSFPDFNLTAAIQLNCERHIYQQRLRGIRTGHVGFSRDTPDSRGDADSNFHANFHAQTEELETGKRNHKRPNLVSAVTTAYLELAASN